MTETSLKQTLAKIVHIHIQQGAVALLPLVYPNCSQNTQRSQRCLVRPLA